MTPTTRDPLLSKVTVLADSLQARAWHIAVAESLTGGLLAASIAQGPRASEWFKGGVVAYQVAIKQKLLGVSDVPVVSELCACEMAHGVSTLMDAEIGVALTGVGGPGPSDGQDPGTVWIAVHTADGDIAQLVQLKGHSPRDICTMSCAIAIDLANHTIGPTTLKE